MFNFKINRFKMGVIIYIFILFIFLYKKPKILENKDNSTCILPVAIIMISIISYYISLLSGYIISYDA